jgi:YebC/PmpR family DNA-binding regulatory protein
MSLHSKWAQIKRDKAVNDSKRSKVFSKVAKAITVAAKHGGGDVDANPTLRLLVEKAKEARMPKDNIERAIKKGSGAGSESVNFEDVVYEGFGSQGEAFLIKGLTDNRNRTVAEIRGIFGKYGGSLGTVGSTAYIFANDPENPLFVVEIKDHDHLESLKNLIDDLEDNDDVQEVYVNFDPTIEQQ